MSRARRVWTTRIAVGVLLLVSFYFLIPLDNETAGYFDVTAGRLMLTKSIWHFTYIRRIEDTEITKLYRKYVSDDVPEPMWWLSSSSIGTGTLAGYVKVHSDGWGGRVIGDMRAFVRKLWLLEEEGYELKPEVIGKLLTNYFSILSGGEDYAELHRESSAYFEAAMRVLEDSRKEVEPKDIPTAGEFLQWREERHARIGDQ